MGERENVLDFVYDEEGKWTEENDDGAEIEYSIPLSFDMVRTRTMEVPSEIFRMRYMDLKEGGEGCLTYDGNKRASLNAAASEYDDEERFSTHSVAGTATRLVQEQKRYLQLCRHMM